MANEQLVFKNRNYDNLSDARTSLIKNWDEGYKMFDKGYLDPFISKKVEDKNESSYWELLYKTGDRKELFWRGKTYLKIEDFSKDLLKEAKGKNMNFYTSILENEILSIYLSDKDKLKSDKLKKIEKEYDDLDDNHDKQTYLYQVARILNNDKVFIFEKTKFKTVDEFSSFLDKELKESRKSFEKHCQTLVDDSGQLDLYFVSWLLELGYNKEVEEWKSYH